MNRRILSTTLLLAALFAMHASARQGQAPRAVIVTGENSFNGHVWKETSVALKNILEAGKVFSAVQIEADPNFIGTEAFLGYDVAVFDFRNAKPLASDAAVQANLLKFLEQGKGFVAIHWANGAFPYWSEYNNMVGRSQLSRHDKRGPFTVRIVDMKHPITAGLKDFETDDELYWDNKMGYRPSTTLAVARSNIHVNGDFAQAVIVQYGNGRVFNTPLGHDVKALQTPGTAELIRRGTAWAAGLLR
jgi:type 1 glutamine amidotransferase